MGKVFNALSRHRKETGDIKKKPGVQDATVPEGPLSIVQKTTASERPSSIRQETTAPKRRFSIKNLLRLKRFNKKDRQPKKEIEENSRFDPSLIVINRPNSFESEQFKILRTNILFPSNGSPPKSIMVTSALPGEGKSFVASNLAVSIAQNINEYVLLLDCDLRKSSIHNMFGFGEEPGLSEYLLGQSPLDKLLLKTEIDKLTILPAGNAPSNPAELLSSEKMKKLLEEVRDRYADRYIIIDSPPPKLTAETSAIANFVDGILLVIRFGDTPRQEVSELVGTLGKEKMLGTIVNRFESITSGLGKLKRYNRYYTK